MSFIDVLPESSPSSFPFSPFASFVFASSFLSLSSIFLNQNIILPAIEVQLFPHEQTNFTLALSLNCRHPLGMSVSVGPSFHLSGLKTLKISSKAFFHFFDNSRCGVTSSSSRWEAILWSYRVKTLTGFSLINKKRYHRVTFVSVRSSKRWFSYGQAYISLNVSSENLMVQQNNITQLMCF